MKPICLDNHFVSWGIRQKPDPGFEDMPIRTKHLFYDCEEKNIPIIIPALVLGESLCGIPIEEHGAFLNDMRRNFEIVPYDTQSALFNARIWHEKKALIKEIIEKPGDRQAIKTDICILSIALARGCNILYTNDEKLQKLASKYIDVKTVGDLPIKLETKSFM